MLEIILMGFIGNSFYNLAGKHSKNKWGYAIAGVVSVYLGLVISGMIMALGIDIISPGALETINEMLLGVMAIPLALMLTWGFYRYLKTTWEKRRIIENADVLDDGMIEQ